MPKFFIIYQHSYFFSQSTGILFRNNIPCNAIFYDIFYTTFICRHNGQLILHGFEIDYRERFIVIECREYENIGLGPIRLFFLTILTAGIYDYIVQLPFFYSSIEYFNRNFFRFTAYKSTRYRIATAFKYLQGIEQNIYAFGNNQIG